MPHGTSPRGTLRTGSQTGERLFGVVLAAAVSALLWALIIRGAAALFGYGISNAALAWTVLPIAAFLAVLLTPLILRDQEIDAADGEIQDAIADHNVRALRTVEPRRKSAIRRRRASSA